MIRNYKYTKLLKLVKRRDLRDNTMADLFIYIHNDDTQNFSFCRIRLVVETFRQST